MLGLLNILLYSDVYKETSAPVSKVWIQLELGFQTSAVWPHPVFILIIIKKYANNISIAVGNRHQLKPLSSDLNYINSMQILSVYSRKDDILFYLK